MIDYDKLRRRLRSLGLDKWADELPALTEQRFDSATHGDLPKWTAAVESLRGSGDPVEIKALLLQLSPWRKGPFDVGGVTIDAEWRSHIKWQRIAGAIESLAGRKVLDVGCGNGYYALQMREAGAECVIGVDPTLLYVMQFLAVNSLAGIDDVFVLPIRMQELPLPAKRFDTTFSMGVLYHQRGPIDHLRQLRDTLRPGGQLVLETIFVPGDESYACTPADRYARMKNVWLLPTIAELSTWLQRSGFRGIDIVDTSITTTDEQRSTEWMTFESLAEALDPADPSRTVEGWPAPRRVVVTAKVP